MNDKKIVHNFKSYITLDSIKDAKSNSTKNGAIQELKPKLLNGELVPGAAHNVVLLSPLTDRENGRMGSLFVTNYKLSFVPIEPVDTEPCQRNNLLGPHDVPLSSVGAVWLTDGGLARRRRLLPTSAMPAKVKGLQVICKNMKVLTFNFRYSPIGQGRTVAAALLHHAFPKRHDLLFAYECREPYYPALHMNMFLRPGDWKRELERTGCPHWRISCVNATSDAFMSGASETLVVPSSALDFNLTEASRHFVGGRVPVWVWGRASGAALLRSGGLLPTEHAATAESVLLEQVRRSHPKLTAPHILYLCGGGLAAPGELPPPALLPLPALLASWRKLADLCTPPTLRDFWEQDSSYYKALDASGWLRHVSGALTLAADAARRLADNVTVVLQEGDGADYAAVVSSLTQLLMDARARTVLGLQALVQKEWVALGHPFCDRLGHVTPSPTIDKEESSGTAPVFLLFLDCCWQLTQQFPAAFQFTETYLTTLWDAAHNQLFDTFIFNSPRDRELAVAKNMIQRPVWDWGEQFSDRETAIFYNPLYVAPSSFTPASNRLSTISTLSRSGAGGRGLDGVERLTPCTNVAAMELWSQCYERWLPILDIPGGGTVQYQMFNNELLQQIHELKEQLSNPTRARPASAHPSRSERRSARETPERTAAKRERTADNPLVSRFHPFSSGDPDIQTPSLRVMQETLASTEELFDSLSLMNAPD